MEVLSELPKVIVLQHTKWLYIFLGAQQKVVKIRIQNLSLQLNSIMCVPLGPSSKVYQWKTSSSSSESVSAEQQYQSQLLVREKQESQSHLIHRNNAHMDTSAATVNGRTNMLKALLVR